MVADLFVQLFATVVILGMLGLVLLIYLNRRQDEEFERSYEDPASFRRAMRVHLNNQLGKVEKNINTTVKNVVDTVKKMQPRAPKPVAISLTSTRPQRKAEARLRNLPRR